MAHSFDRANVISDEIAKSSQFGQADTLAARVENMDQPLGVTARRRKRTAARASASGSSRSCSDWATRTG